MNFLYHILSFFIGDDLEELDEDIQTEQTAAFYASG